MFHLETIHFGGINTPRYMDLPRYCRDQCLTLVIDSYFLFIKQYLSIQRIWNGASITFIIQGGQDKNVIFSMLKPSKIPFLSETLSNNT